MQLNTKVVAGIVLVSVLLTLAYGPAFVKYLTKDIADGDGDGGSGDGDIIVPPGVKSSQFKFTPVRKDATATAVTGATTRVWYDTNKDGKMQYNELKRMTESSGTYTSQSEYPIGEDYTFWVEVQASNYFTAYIQMYMTGQPAADLTAKTAEICTGSTDEMIYIDDSLTFSGLIGNVPWDDGTDYNYTLNGAEENAKIITTLSAADKGIASQVWEQVNYETIYSSLSNDANKEHSYWVKWDEITDQGIQKFYAPTFLGAYFSEQDAIDLGIKTGDWDGYHYDPTNTYFWASESIQWTDLFYYSSDNAAAEGEFSFSVDISAAGASVATYGIAWWINLEYDDMCDGSWGTSSTYYLGTPGDDWDWVA